MNDTRHGIPHFLPVLLVVSLSACTGQIPSAPSSSSTVPTPGESLARAVSGIVIDASGACIGGAIVEVVAGQAVGQKSAQSGPCDHWWPFNGFAFSNLTPGVSLTLRATAPGHVAKEMTVMPGVQNLEFLLEPLPGS